MALNRKGWRALKLAQRTLYWRARKGSTDTPQLRRGQVEVGAALVVVVVSSEAFHPGKTGQRLEFALPRGSTVSSLAVRFVVDHTPEFTGKAGAAHVVPTAATLAQARAMCAPHKP